VLKECLFCAEFTGIYSNYVQQVLAKYSLNLWMENPMQIKRTQGMVRGKSDKVDSLRIAQYARKHCDNVKLWMPDRTQVQMLKKLTSLRNRLLNTKKRLQQTFKEQEFLTRKEIEMLKDSCSESLNAIKNDIRQTENKIKEIINNDKELSNLYSIATSVDGIGMHTAVEVIVTTNEFKNISEGKKYACYSGVVPFNYSSGSSVNKRPRISSMANKGVKTLLHMSALSVINMDGELRDYFLRKVGEGKNKMSVLNAIRNKLILRIFACVKNNRPYQKKLNNSLA
jgi:transposase